MSIDLLVISAHSADYVWRSGGTIAKYVKDGRKVQVVCLSFGERGESAQLWKQNKTLEEIKQLRKGESQAAADILGVPVKFLDWDDYPLKISEERVSELVKIIRKYKPVNVLTHGNKDPFNIDHVTTYKSVMEASILSIAPGVMPEIPPASQARIFGFEHHQSELSGFYPDVILDITEVFEIKKDAMNCFQSQNHLIQYYTFKAEIRGNHARRISGVQTYKQAESFVRYYPYVGDVFV